MKINGYEHINLAYLNLMADNDAGMRRTMINMLLEEIPFEINRMVHLAKSASWDQLQQVAHKMKSTLAFVGNEYMIHYNKNVESNAKNKVHLDDIPAHLEEMKSLSVHVLKELETALNEEG